MVAAAPDGWVALKAVLLMVAGEGPRLCADVGSDGSCTEGAAVSGVDVQGLLTSAGETSVTLGGTWITRVESGALVDLTRVPEAQQPNTLRPPTKSTTLTFLASLGPALCTSIA